MTDTKTWELDPGSGTEWISGQIGDRYRLLFRIGRGGMGEVHAAHDRVLDRAVAIKVLHRGSAARIGEERLRSEGRAIARLDHPNVVKVYDVLHDGDDLCIAMEFVDGPTLEDALASEERSWREVLELFAAAGRGLAAVHRAGIVHRDFKPSNVMLASSGSVKVLDFGIARFLDAAATDLTSPAPEARDSLEQIGTPAYLAPERWQGRPADQRSDQFSFCVALWEALAGEHPFFTAAGPTTAEPEPSWRLRAWPRRLPTWLGKILRRGLELDPDHRFPSMDALLDALGSRLVRRRRVSLAALSLILLLAVGVGGYSLNRDRPFCDAGELQLEDVWDDRRKAEVRAAFDATGSPRAGDIWNRVETLLDRQAESWRQMKRETCEATYRRGEQSTQLLDLRMLCLDRRRAELRTLVDVLSTADGAMLRQAVPRAAGLDEMAACRSSLELAELTPLPQDPDLRQEIRRATAAIEERRVRLQLGSTVELDEAQQIIEEARDLAYPPLTARALDLAVRILLEDGDHRGAARAAEEALSAAIGAGDRLLQARLHGLLVEIHGYFLADTATARWWERFAEASIDALSERHPDAEFEIQLSLARHAALESRDEDVIERSRRAIEVGEGLWGEDDPRIAKPLNNLGMTLIASPDPARRAKGFDHLRRAIALRERQLGADDSSLAPSLVNLAGSLAVAGRYREALDLARRSHDLLVRDYPEGTPDVAIPEVMSAQVLLKMNRPQRALDHLARAIPVISEGFGPRHPMLADALITRHDAVLLAAGDLAAAGAALARVEEIVEPLSEVHPLRFGLHEARGRWWLEQGERRQAHQSFEVALDQADRLGTSPALGRLAVLCGLGEAELALGRLDRARSTLEQALDLVEPGVDPLVSSRVRFALARSLPLEDSARAQRLAAAALAELPGRSPWSERFRGQVEAFLTARSRTF